MGKNVSEQIAAQDVHLAGPSNMPTKSVSAVSIPTFYDEAHRGIWHEAPEIPSLRTQTALNSHLEHHEITTDGSFGICIAGGAGVYIDRQL